jgi:cell division protein FtsW
VSRKSWLGQWNSPVASYYLILGVTALLTAIGLAMVLSASSVRALNMGDSPYSIFLGQARFALLGAVALCVTALVPVRFYRKGAWFILAGAMGLQLLIFSPLALSAGGNTNWVNLGFTAAQPSEVVKLGLAIWLGAVLARKQALIGQWTHALIPAVPVAAVAVGLVLGGHDLGTAIILMMIVAGALWVAGVPGRLFAIGGSVAAIGMVALAQTDNRAKRIAAWLGENCDEQAACYQTKHGLWALGTGGWGGVGLGAGREKWLYLPEAHNDFIFAVVGEELGLQGTLLMLVLFGVLGAAMTRVVLRHPDPFVKITTAAIAAWIIGQALVNVAVVIGLLPVIGVPLPLVSAGGSALIMTMAAIGVVVAFARDEPEARAALAARPRTVRRSIAVVARGGARRLGRRGTGRASERTSSGSVPSVRSERVNRG